MTTPPGSSRHRLARVRFPIRGPRVDLRPTVLGDLPPLVRLLSEPSVSRWTLHIPFPYRESDGREWIRRARVNRRAGRGLALSVVRRSDGRLLGGVGLHHLEEGDGAAEVGYWLGREYRGRGYASEAVELIVRVGFRRLGLHRIEARVFPANLASRGVARRCGFRYEGRLRDEAWKDGRWRAILLFARLASDPPGRGGLRSGARRR